MVSCAFVAATLLATEAANRGDRALVAASAAAGGLALLALWRWSFQIARAAAVGAVAALVAG